MERVSIFIDGNNFYFGLRKIYGTNKSLKKFSFQKFASLLAENREIIDIFYYNAQLDKEQNIKKYESQQEFFRKVRKVPNFHLILCKLLKRNVKGTSQFYYILKEDDIHMAVDMVENAGENRFDTAIVVSGDGDFVPAVKAVKRKDKKVENVYFKDSSSRNLQDHCHKSLKLTKETLDSCFEQ